MRLRQIRQRYQCKDCSAHFDDLTGTIFAGHHQPLRVWMLCLYLMGLNLSSRQIAQELDLDEDNIHDMTAQLRQGIVDGKPEIQLAGEVECDEVYVSAGHKGNPEAVKKKGHWTAQPPQRGSGSWHPRKREAAYFRDDSTRWRGRDSDASQRPAGDHQTVNQGNYFSR
jgi:hypothetical protein